MAELTAGDVVALHTPSDVGYYRVLAVDTYDDGLRLTLAPFVGCCAMVGLGARRDPLTCVLADGHGGDHEDPDGSRWTDDG